MLQGDSSLVNYQILAVKQAFNNKIRRNTLEIQAGPMKVEAMVDSGSLLSFLDFETAEPIVQTVREY